MQERLHLAGAPGLAAGKEWAGDDGAAEETLQKAVHHPDLSWMPPRGKEASQMNLRLLHRPLLLLFHLRWQVPPVDTNLHLSLLPLLSRRKHRLSHPGGAEREEWSAVVLAAPPDFHLLQLLEKQNSRAPHPASQERSLLHLHHHHHHRHRHYHHHHHQQQPQRHLQNPNQKHSGCSHRLRGRDAAGRTSWSEVQS